MSNSFRDIKVSTAAIATIFGQSENSLFAYLSTKDPDYPIDSIVWCTYVKHTYLSSKMLVYIFRARA